MKTGWEVKTLNQISENLDNRRVPITKKIRSNGSIPYYGASGIVDYVEEYIFDEDLLLVSEDGANLLARTYPIAFSINGKTWVNNHAHVLRFKDKISQRFVEFYLNSIKLDDFVSGMAQPKLNQTMLNKIPIPFPPISEQKHIVAILDEAFESITKAKENAEKNLKNAKEIFESYLQSVFENKGDGWEEKTLMEVSDQITDGSHFSPNSSTEDEYPYITVKDIEDDVIDFEICKFISKENYQALLKNGCKPNLGDILFSKDGTVGKVSLVNFEKDFVVLSSLAIIRPNRKIIDSSLLKYILKNPSFLEIAVGKKTGVAIRRIILKNLKMVRRVRLYDEWWFVISDVVAVLTDSVNPSDYLKKLRKRDQSLSDAFKGGGQIVPPPGIEFDTACGRQMRGVDYTICSQLKMRVIYE